MKKTLAAISGFLCLASYTITPSFAQDEKPVKKKHDQNVVLGIEAGANFANMNEQYTGNTNSYSFKTGGLLGFVIDAPSSSSNHVYLQPGLFYMLNGTHVSGNDGTANISVKTLELPINILYKSGNPGGNRFFIGAGPYVAYNMGGQSSNADPNTNGGTAQVYNYTFKIGSRHGVDDIKAVDLGLGINTGFQLACGVYFRLRFQKGLSDMSPNEGTTIHTTSIGLQAGYMFHKKGMVQSKGVKKEKEKEKVKKERTRSPLQED